MPRIFKLWQNIMGGLIYGLMLALFFITYGLFLIVMEEALKSDNIFVQCVLTLFFSFWISMYLVATLWDLGFLDGVWKL